MKQQPNIKEIKMINTTKQEQLNQDLYWLTSALSKSKSDLRPHIVNTYVRGNKMLATDGQRLHEITIDREVYVNVKDGFYSVIKRTKTNMILAYNVEHNADERDYPDCKSLLERPDGKSFVVMQHENNSSQAMANIIRAMDDGSINYNYLNDVLSDENAWDVTIKDHEHPLHFENGNKKAIVMPIRIK